MKQEILEYNKIKYIIEIGENKYDNFEIIDKAEKSDIWFHVDGLPSCHVILKTHEKIKHIPLYIIKQCAYLCKINSKAKTLQKCGICYTTIDNISKTDIIGQVNIKNFKVVYV